MYENDLLKFEKAVLFMIDRFPSMCQMQKDYFDELKKSGFNDEQALELTKVYISTILRGASQ